MAPPLTSPLTAVTALLLAVLVAPVPGAAQSALILDVRGGVSVPAGSLRNAATLGEGPAEVGSGPGIGVHFGLRRSAHHGFYAGFSQLRFDCAPRGCPGSGELVATSWDLGLHLLARRGAWEPWLRLGAVLAHTERPVRAGETGETEVRASDVGLGGEAGVGVRVRVTGNLALNPGVRYTRVDSELDDGDVLGIRAWVADVGLTLSF